MAGFRIDRLSAILALAILGQPLGAQTPDMSELYEDILAYRDEAEFPPMTGPVEVVHSAHPEAASEVWTITAHLRPAEGAPVGMQVVLSRLGLRRGGANEFDLRALYRGHVIVTGEGIAEERLSRGLGAAGEGGVFVWIDDWSLGVNALDSVFLTVPAGDRDMSLFLKTRSGGPATLVQEGETVRGYSLPDVEVSAVIGEDVLQGRAWFDHFWGDVPLPGGPLAYDRLVLHLDDGSAVSLLRTRRRDGAGIATLDGVLVGPDGGTTPLSDEMVALEEMRLTGPGMDLRFEVSEEHVAEFLVPLTTLGLTVSGTRDGAPVTGSGTLQLSEAGK